MAPTLCRDCLSTRDTAGRETRPAPDRCPDCGSPRLLGHPEMFALSLAHLDCDAFFAAVEKRDDPALRDRPLIIGGGRRGVVATCCYLARTHGVHSAMPMFKARKLCPDAVVMPSNMKKYAAVSRQIRDLMEKVTPLVQPLSLDEAFLDLAGTERLHGRSPAETLAALALEIETETGISVSVGLSYNKFLAKVASELDKPRGFAVIGRAEARDFLSGKPVSLLWGVGKAMQARLARDGFSTIGQFLEFSEAELVGRYGAIGARIAAFARGQDSRRVIADAPAKSISAETTFERDLSDRRELEKILWTLCQKVSGRLKKNELAGTTAVLKLRTGDFRIRTRGRRLPAPTQLADTLYRHGCALLRPEATGQAFRLIGIGVSGLVPGAGADPLDLADPDAAVRARAERAVDAVRARYGDSAIGKGLEPILSSRDRGKP